MQPAPYTRVEAPTLKINEILGMSPDRRLEQLIVANLLAHLETNGWKVSGVDDGDEFEKVSTAAEAMELIFNLDESRPEFTNGEESHRILLVCGNGQDILCDWSFFEDDRDGFNAVMDAFDAEEFFGK